MGKYIIGNIVHAVQVNKLEILTNHLIYVNGNIIERCSPFSEAEFKPQSHEEVIYLTQTQFLFPGFVDTHIHAPQYPNTGIFGESTLLDWLQKYTFPTEGRFKDISNAKDVYSKLIKRQLNNGTTTSSYYGTIHVPATIELAKLCLEQNMRGRIGRVCMEKFCPEFLNDGSIESDIQFIEEMERLDPSGAMVKPIITPRFAPSCEFSTLKGLGELAEKKKLSIQTHVSENLNEIKWVKELFKTKSYCDVYDEAGLLKKDTILAHAIHLTDDELNLIKERDCGVSHCPDSNAALASGIAPVKKYLRHKLKVGLGTDVSAGCTVSVLKNARLALLMSRLLTQRESESLEIDELNKDKSSSLTVDEALSMATLGGAQVMSMDKEIGNFEIGKKLDAQIVDIASDNSEIDIFDMSLPSNEIDRVRYYLNKWVYIGDDRNTVCVFVDGKKVVSKI
ncbi:guanine deaminase [Starmerella bacillaris]|uniref:Guanine deaminase n=1 Tax=Starmerella bacillaris TaxID=1247836 RepID=A0AAV5RRJ5_STABA|nr:guanine deaminase [Starmerella bacillaris]